MKIGREHQSGHTGKGGERYEKREREEIGKEVVCRSSSKLHFSGICGF